MENTEKSGFIFTVFKGVGIALIATLFGVLIFAGLIKTLSLDVSVIKPVNQFIKVLAIFLGCFFSIKKGFALFKGALIGVITVTFTYLLFALIGGGVSFKLSFFVDLIFGLVSGMISGIISANVRK